MYIPLTPPPNPDGEMRDQHLGTPSHHYGDQYGQDGGFIPQNFWYYEARHEQPNPFQQEQAQYFYYDQWGQNPRQQGNYRPEGQYGNFDRRNTAYDNPSN